MAIFTNVQKSDTPLYPLMFFLMVQPLKSILRNNIPEQDALSRSDSTGFDMIKILSYNQTRPSPHSNTKASLDEGLGVEK